MGSTALKSIAVVLVLLTLLLAALGFVVSRNYASRTLEAEAAAAKAAQAQQETSKAMAVVAIKPLAAYKTISRENLRLVPVAVVPTGYFGSIEEVAGRSPLSTIDAGSPVTRRYFKEVNSLAQAIPAGHQALALEINEVIAAGGYVRPGDLVDVLVYLRNGPGISQPQARVLLANVRVLAFEDKVIDRPQGTADADEGAANPGAGNNAARKRQRTAVLAVPDAETTRVLLGAGMGEVRLALRADTSGNKTDADAASEVGLLATKPGKLITAEDLAPPEKPKPAASAVPKPRSTVEVFHGAAAERVPQ